MDGICSDCKKSNIYCRDICRSCYDKKRRKNDPNFIVDRPKSLTEQQINLIIGSLLGDGHLHRQYDNWNASLRIVRAQKDLAYLEWEAKILDNILTKIGITKSEKHDDRSGKTYYRCSLTTQALPILNIYHDKWHKDKIKIIPNDLKLNAEIIAVWFCDDGWIGKRRKNGNALISALATNCFTKDETYFLCDLLNDRYNVKFTVNKLVDARSTRDSYMIRGANEATHAMAADIAPVFPEGMERKKLWEKLPYQAPSSEIKLSKIIQYLKEHDDFFLHDLAEHIGFFLERKNADGSFKVDSVHTRQTYLQKFVDAALMIEIPRQKGSDYIKGTKFQLTPAGKVHFQSSNNSQL